MALNSQIFNNSLIITGSVTSSVGFKGDGSGLTNIPAPSAEWDGSREGNASITGSLVVSGSTNTVDFTNVANISGSVFSGSFVGNGSGLTNLNITGITGSNNILSGSFSGSFEGDGSGLTGLNNFPFSGSAIITGSLTVSSSVVDLSNATAISGSTFSGSFVGDASGLTNLPETEWDGSRNGNASITGSFVVSGSSPAINLKGITTIDSNIVISNRSSLVSVNSSIGIGENSLPSSTVDRDTIVIGQNSGRSAISGSNNIVIGNDSFNCAVRTEHNIAIGLSSLTNYIGVKTGVSNNPGGNIAIGFNAQKANQDGKLNTVVGNNAMCKGTGGCCQTFIGAAAGQNSSEGENTAVGESALCANTNGKYNTALGNSAGLCAKGSCTTAIGSFTLVGDSSGEGNTALGFKAGHCVIGSSKHNIYIGPGMGPSSATTQCFQFYLGNSCRTGANAEQPLLRGDFEKQQLTVYNQVSASVFSGSFVGDGSGLTDVAGAGFPYTGEAQITGSLIISRSLGHNSNALHIKNGHVVLTMVSESLDFKNDVQAAAGNVPLGGLYRSGNIIAIRLK